MIGAVSLALGTWVVLADPATATAEMVRLVELINAFVRVSIAVTIVLTAVTGALELRRLLRMTRSPERCGTDEDRRPRASGVEAVFESTASVRRSDGAAVVD